MKDTIVRALKKSLETAEISRARAKANGNSNYAFFDGEVLGLKEAIAIASNHHDLRPACECEEKATASGGCLS